MITLKRVNKEIQKKYPHLVLERGGDYFYFTSDDQALSEALVKAKTTAVYVYRLNHQTLEQWLADADAMMKEVA